MEITIKDVMRVIKRFFCLILVLTVMGGALAGLYSYFGGDAKHVSEAKVVCKNTTAIDDFKEQITSDTVIESTLELIKDNYPDIESEELKSIIFVEQVDKTKYAIVKVEHVDSGTAYFVCSALTDVLTSNLTAYVSGVVSYPSLETMYETNIIRNTIIGTVCGFALSIIIAFIFAVSTKLVYSRSDIEKYFDVNVLGAIPKRNKCDAMKLLSVNTKDTLNKKGAKKLAVTSVGKQKRKCLLFGAISRFFGMRRDYQGVAGKDIAISLAELGKKTVYIDALNNECSQYGLNDYLSDNKEKNPVLVTSNRNLFVIKGGKKNKDFIQLLSTEKMKKLLDVLANQCDYVIIDLPSMASSAAAVAVSDIVDGYALSVKLKTNNLHQVNNALGMLNQLTANVSGIVLENAPRKEVFGGRTLIKKGE